MIKVIAFDISGVIMEPVLRNWFDAHSLDRQHYRSITKDWDLGIIDMDESFQRISKVSGIPKDNVYNEIFKQAVFKEDVLHLVRSLKSNYSIALFSNNLSPLIKKIFSEHGLLELFDDVIISSDHGLVKPDEAYFRKMISIVNVATSEVIFIDDKKEHVIAGNNLGITSLLFTDATTLRNDLKKLKIQGV